MLYEVILENFLNLQSLKQNMGLTSYMGHRILAIALALFAVGSFLAASSAYMSSPAVGYITTALAIISTIASAYFFKTQH